jgi:hypothetical protein
LTVAAVFLSSCLFSNDVKEGEDRLSGIYTLNLGDDYNRYLHLQNNGEFLVHDSIVDSKGKCLNLESKGKFRTEGDTILHFLNGMTRDRVSGCGDTLSSWRNDGDGKYRIRNISDSSFEYSTPASSNPDLWKVFGKID